MAWNFVVILFTLALSIYVRSQFTWTYTNPVTNPKHWAIHYPACGGQKQSPINIEKNNTVYNPAFQAPRIFWDSDETAGRESYTVCRTGNTVTISVPKDSWFLSFDHNMAKQFELVQMHFHWGATLVRGSEHHWNGEPYPAEAHVVFYNKMLYQSYEMASGAPMGHAVLAFGLHLPRNSTDATWAFMSDLMEAIEWLKQNRTSFDIPGFDLRTLIPANSSNRYYRYEGSLTTPPCVENVIWTVFRDPISITTEQLDILRSLPNAEGEIDPHMQDNYREPMPLNTKHSLVPRTLFRSFP